MTEKVFNKDVIVVADLSGLSMKDKTERIGVMAQAMIDNPEIVLNISPSGEVVSTNVEEVNAKILLHRSMEEALSAFTFEIKGDVKKLENGIVKVWMPQVEKACGGDIEKIYKLCFGVKNTKSKITTKTKGKVTNSYPIITSVDGKIHLVHRLHIINSATQSVAKPIDALQVCVYGQIGGVEPTDVNKMFNWGIVERGNFAYTFDPADIDKAVYYMAGYISSKTKKVVVASPVFKAFIS